MCISFASTHNQVWVRKNFNVELPIPYPTEAFPGYAAPLIVKSHQSGRVACGLAEFGLIPHWSKDRKIQKHTYNARIETISEKPSYRTAWTSRRFGIALVDHFYEPSYLCGKAVRTAIRNITEEPLGIASIWDTWTDVLSGEIITSFSLITINADEHPFMKNFHRPNEEKRTIVCLKPHLFDGWLSTTPENVQRFLNHASMTELQ
jgi:putative SOS response-associated peptidase YedK